MPISTPELDVVSHGQELSPFLSLTTCSTVVSVPGQSGNAL